SVRHACRGTDGPVRISDVPRHHSQSHYIEGPLALNILDRQLYPLVYELILHNCRIGVDTDQEPAAPGERLGQPPIVRKNIAAGTDIEPGASWGDQSGDHCFIVLIRSKVAEA